VDISLRVALGIIDYVVNVYLFQSGVRRERIGKNFGAFHHFVFDVLVQPSAASVSDNTQFDARCSFGLIVF